MQPVNVTSVLLCLNILCILFTSIQGQGAFCNDANTGLSGTCILLGQCPSAINAIQNGIYPQICDFQGTVPIVCCTDNSPTTARTTTKRVTTTATRRTTSRPTEAPVLKGRICEQKCVEYGRSVYVLERPPILLPGASWNNVSLCGHKVVPLIVGGEKAGAKEFPHMALLGFGEADSIQWSCGGTLISARFVLTAAHCLYDRSLGDIRWVRLGDLNKILTSDDAQPEEFSITERIKHPNYKPPSQYDDIALLKMDRDVKFNAYIRPACLHPVETLTNKKAIATGWGNTDFGGRDSNDLLKVTLDMYDQASCNTSYRSNISARKLKYGIVPQTQICAGGTTESKDTCQGDSGGPLQIFNLKVTCMYSLIGVTSFGKACGAIRTPGVYTRVSAYVPWIESVVWPSS